jgi:hypothetical protein
MQELGRINRFSKSPVRAGQQLIHEEAVVLCVTFTSGATETS